MKIDDDVAKELLKTLEDVLEITEFIGKKTRNPYAYEVLVPWRMFDRLADQMRRAGLEPRAKNLGEHAYDRVNEAKGRIREQVAEAAERGKREAGQHKEVFLDG